MKLSIIDKWGKKRKAVRFSCSLCKKEVVQRIWKNRPNKFCSMECAGSARKIPSEVECFVCKKIFNRQPCKVRKINFCSRKCKELFQSEEKHPNWKNGYSSYRERAIKKNGLSCAKGNDCLLKTLILPDFAFDVDHIDSNRDNNKIGNLQVLCLLCHRKKTFKI